MPVLADLVIDLIRLPEAALAKGRQLLMEPWDVLLSIKGSLGKVAMVQYFRSAVGQTLLVRAGQRPDVAFVPMGEVKGLPIVIPHPSELQRAQRMEEEGA